MKIEETAVETFTFGQKETSVAKIQASAKAFEILSSSLYSNSVLAIIRELCANAKDSHTAAGKKKEPFQVQIPNDLDPQFKVRDFGVGMTHEFVMNRLNTYFDSTKNGSNDEIGGFGLGIKSVFSYTSSFTIACYDGQVRRVYTYQIGSTGLPEISFLAETESTEPVGVEVCVPVKKEDYEEFRSNAVEALTFYKPRPTITGIDKSRFVIKKIYEGTNWTIYQNPGQLTSESYVEMGDVIYPIPDVDFDEYDHIPNHMRAAMRQHNFRRHHGHNSIVVVYTAGIGDIDITPNREQIKLTAKSKTQIKQFESVVKVELQGQIQKFIDEFTCSYWDLIKDSKVTDLVQSSIIRKFGVDADKIKYRGHPISGNRNISYTKKNGNADVLKMINNIWTMSENYGELNRRKLDFGYYGIDISSRYSKIPYIVIGDKSVGQELTSGKFKAKFGETSVYVVECAAKNNDAVIADLNRIIPDFSDRIMKWSDIKDDLKDIKDTEYSAKYDIKAGGYYYNVDPVPFEETLFDGMTEVFYELQDATGQIPGTKRAAQHTKLGNAFHYMSEELQALILKTGVEVIWALTQNQVDLLAAKGIKMTSFSATMDAVLLDVATKFANSRPTMTLKEYLKPITDKNKRICLSTHYKAVKRWVNESGDKALLELLRALNDEASSSYRHSADDQLFRALTKKGIKDYIAEKKIVSTNVTSNQVIKDLVAKAPLCARLVSDYTDQDVIDYVLSAMGWTKPAPVVTTKAKRPPKRVAKAAPTVVQTVDPNAVLAMVTGI